MNIDIQTYEDHSDWRVRLRVSLDRGETTTLFMAGDSLISWPTEGSRSTGTGPMERSSMFLSEIVSRDEGLELAYESEELAQRASLILSHQLQTALPE